MPNLALMREGRTRHSLTQKEQDGVEWRKTLEKFITGLTGTTAFICERDLSLEEIETLSISDLVEIGGTTEGEQLFLTSLVVGPKLTLVDGINKDFPQLSKASVCVALPGDKESIDPDKTCRLCVLARDFPVPSIR
jgi:hypothetical protein